MYANKLLKVGKPLNNWALRLFASSRKKIAQQEVVNIQLTVYEPSEVVCP